MPRARFAHLSLALLLLMAQYCCHLHAQDTTVIADAADTDVAIADSETAIDQPKPTARVDLDPLGRMQDDATANNHASWGRWGVDPSKYSSWTDHSNRLIPVYTFGLTLGALREEGSAYASPERLQGLYGKVPERTVNPTALYYDQTDIYRLQEAAVQAGYSNIILMVFDGMDWQTTRAAAIYKTGKPAYTSGRGTGLAFLDERRIHTDYGFVCTSPYSASAEIDVTSQTVLSVESERTGGYDPKRAGEAPWHERSTDSYLIGTDRAHPDAVTDSAASATSMCTGIKTFNGAINMAIDGKQLVPIARRLQDDEDFKIGLVTSVPIPHATPAACYANNVTRKDYQDISRDLLGLPSSSHRTEPLRGVDVLIGAGWGIEVEEDELQGDNFIRGNRYLHENDLARSDLRNGGRYRVAQRTPGKPGRKVLMRAARRAADNDERLLGFFGASDEHLPFQTADGRFDPVADVDGTETYTTADLEENPSLADMTRAALLVLEQAVEGFWLMIEAGDVDWANHSNNLDNSIGAVLSGDDAFQVVMDWVDDNNAWSYTAVIVTADHGHFLVIDDADRIIEAGNETRNGEFPPITR